MRLKASNSVAIGGCCVLGFPADKSSISSRHFFFFFKPSVLINLWNSLPQTVVMASGWDVFKRGVGQIDGGKGSHGFQAVHTPYHLQVL